MRYTTRLRNLNCPDYLADASIAKERARIFAIVVSRS